MSQDPLGEAARRGAQLILQRVLEAEVEAFLGRGRYERAKDGALQGHRNGYEPKTVHMAEGSIELAVPQVVRPTLKTLIYNAFTAKTYADGLKQAQAIVAEYQERFPAAMKCLAQDIEECLTALKMPLAHRRQTRTTNVLERLFGEGKRRSKITPRFTSEDSGLALMFAVLLDASEGWHGLRMNDALRQRLQVMRTDPDSPWEDPDLKDLAA